VLKGVSRSAGQRRHIGSKLLPWCEETIAAWANKKGGTQVPPF